MKGYDMKFNTMTAKAFFRTRLFLTGVVTMATWSVLIGNHYDGGVSAHHWMHRMDLPQIFDWWSGILLPLLAMLLSSRIQKRQILLFKIAGILQYPAGKNAPAMLIVLLLVSLEGYSQKVATVTGTVTDESLRPLAGASIFLSRVTDTVLVKSTFTNSNGVYKFEGIEENHYLVKASVTGFKAKTTVISASKGLDVVVPVITMLQESKDLMEVQVQARKRLFEQKPDKMIVNVHASASHAGASALEILEKSPGITIDRDGNVSLKGKAGVQIFIDGKPSYLSGQDLVNYLRNLQGTQLDKLEIMTNPPAKFDAAGNSGIIHIKTKKAVQPGYSATFTTGYTQGIYARNNQDINVNYRKNKLNLFGTVSRNERTTLSTFIIDRKFTDPSTNEIKTLLYQRSTKQNWNASNNFKFGVDLFITKKTTVGTVVNGFYNPENSVSSGTVYISDPANQLLASTFSRSISKSSWKNFSTNVNLRHLFDSTGRELMADLDYISYNGANTQNLSNYFYDALGATTEKPDTLYGNLPQLIHIYTAKADYIHPLKKRAKLEAGIKAAFVKTDANAVYDSLINKRLVPDVGRSNHFVYDESIAAAYVSYSQPFSKKFNGQVGLRLENTLAHGKQLTSGEQFTLNYTQLFPTAYLSYKASDKNAWTMNYGRRIRRPDYESLNPFVKFLDRYTFEQGNPNLRPQYSHNAEVTHSFSNFISTTINYTNTTNIIQLVLEQDEHTNQSIGKQSNIANQRQYGIAVHLFKQVKKFSGTFFVNAYNNQFSGLVNNSFVNIGANTAVFNTSVSYQFKSGLTTELSGFYRTAGVEGIFRIAALGAVNFGASLPLFKNKGMVRLSARDIFLTQKVNGYSRFGAINTGFKMIPDSRAVGINFSYRISKGKLTGSKRKPGGAGDEQNRVKGSDG